ncbi:MAG: MlaE family ABC transporter permease [Thermodesulfobacteriota bacterium]
MPAEARVLVSEQGAPALRLSGRWSLGAPLPSAEEVGRQIVEPAAGGALSFSCQDLASWDSSLLTFLRNLKLFVEARGVSWDDAGLPPGVKRLLRLASAVPERKEVRKTSSPRSLLWRLGDRFSRLWVKGEDVLGFLGELALAMGRLFSGRARLRYSDVFLVMHRCGVQALPIVSLISFLVGLILAFVGAVQLLMFGAQILVAALVGIGMVRVLGAIMTGIIMAGRTGAAFAAELGTMQVNEEIDALRTLGIPPVEFLVLPRVLGLSLMMPLLCAYSDLMGILGGLAVGIAMLDLNVHEYLRMTQDAVKLSYFWIGLFHSLVFGVLVAFTGCLQGMRSGRSASAVGEAATSAVVSGIVAIIVATAIITYLCQVLGI